MRGWIAGGCVLLAGCLFIGSGCKKENGAAPRAGEPGGSPATDTGVPAGWQSRTFEGVSVACPKEWTMVDLPEGKGLEVRPPAAEQEETYPPGVSFEVRQEPAGADLEKEIADAAASLSNRKTGFHLKEKKAIDHPGGFKYGRIFYESLSEEQADPLTQWNLLIPMPGNRRLLINASALTKSWPQYETQFARIIDAVRIVGVLQGASEPR